MDLEARLSELLRAAEEVGLTIQRVPMGGDGGGFCVVKGERRLFIDTMADSETRYERTLAALAPLPEMDKQYLRPEVREDLDRQREQDA